jgi:hypothetical protein
VVPRGAAASGTQLIIDVKRAPRQQQGGNGPFG